MRSGQVHRSLVGHTGAVTSLQFDDVHLVTGSLDRSIRVSLLTLILAEKSINTSFSRYGICELAQYLTLLVTTIL